MQDPPSKLRDHIGLEKLASLPQVTFQLVRICNNPKTDFDELATIIGQDTGLSSKVLRAATSPLYGCWRQVTDLRRVLVILGFKTIKTIAITSSLLDFFSQFHASRSGLLAAFWYRSLFCAHLAKLLAEATGYENPEETYLIGLLHKVGQLVLINSETDRYSKLLKYVQDPRRLRGAERRLFEVDHVYLGAWLVEQWRLGGFISDAILYQHKPGNQLLDSPEAVKLVNLAAGLSDQILRSTAKESAKKLLPLDPEQLDQMLAETEEAVTQVAAALDIQVESPESPPSSARLSSPFPPDRSAVAKAVRDTALVESLKSALCEDASSQPPWVVVQKFLSVLFGLENAAVFLVNGNEQLQGMATGAQDPRFADLAINVDPGRSLLVDSLLQREILDSFLYHSINRKLNVIDRLLVRLCGRSGLLALPLVARDQSLGVVVVGIDVAALEGIVPFFELLDVFMAEAGELILRHREEEENRRLLVAETETQMLMNARRVKHEASNPLNVVSNYLHILGFKLGEESSVQAELDILKEEVTRVSSILTGLTEQIVSTESDTGSLDINDSIERLHSILRPSLLEPHGIEAHLELDGATPRLCAPQDKLRQILLNLMKNAVEAMPRGGELVVGTRASVLNEQGRFVEIRVRDSGPGLPDAVKDHLFKPVLSEKGAGHAGLGLSITAQLVRDLQGHIECRTGVDGTEFIMLFPANL